MNAQNILILPGYYYLYALYADYQLNNAFFSGQEDTQRMREIIRVVQYAREVLQPYRKSWALRLFTERKALARFSPHLVSEVLRELRHMVETLGPPPGWNSPMPTRHPNRYESGRLQRRSRNRGQHGKLTTMIEKLGRNSVAEATPPIVAPPIPTGLFA